MKHFYLDIETKPDPELEDLHKQIYKPPRNVKNVAGWRRKKMATDPDYCKVICIGLYDETEVEPVVFSDIHTAAEWIKQRTHYRMVTFNGKGFDIPAMIKYGTKYDIDFPYKWFTQGLNPYHKTPHLDLMLALSLGNRKWKSLDEYLRIYLGTEKETKQEVFFANATDDELVEHCNQDMYLTKRLFDLFRGKLW